VEREEVVRIAVQNGVPIRDGKIDKAKFEEARDRS
jgi:hypothetical protein